ncbi:uncharacterized protein PAC_17515 [Phialocephala subalpina]|uniref:Heterokaryon incompatibility domain-containing protein n=1 Tax=Phialocephala subalpina TaxID=576137 RepID=A0A1L7XRE3_9HELO|nr:uncharacterized protein PAC_17515 [Phialocephala subalpina]
MQSLQAGPHTFTEDRVRHILTANTHHRDPDARGAPAEFHCLGTAYEYDSEGGFHAFSLPRRQERATTWTRGYCSQVKDPEIHLSLLDDAFSKLLTCHFQLRESADVLVQRTCQILSRLPEVPLAFEDSSRDVLDSLPMGYFIPSNSGCRGWKDLKIVSFVSTNIIRLSLATLMDAETWSGGAFRRLVDTISELLQAFSEDSSTEESPQSRFLVKSFLWSAWQRSMMLFFAYCLEVQLNIGYNWDRNDQLALHPPNIRPQKADFEMPGYMCRWAFELLRTDRGAIGVDFRRFHERYATLFEDRPARCCDAGNSVYVPCDGKAPENCMRFRGMKIEDQSAHDASCSKDCTRLFWDADSFKNVVGARAVSIEHTNATHLGYIAASEKTMAISHVWSHGQGGRPEEGTTGFNSCLHTRYSSLARSIGCDSYWMDTPCIPGLHENQELRTDAINKINEVFATSRVTLVCDRDLMDIDVSNLSPELQECILAALLVCDWNVRAWTLLEAMRGRRNIHLLFKNNAILPCKFLLSTVLHEGSIDLAILFLTAQHLIPNQLAPNQKVNAYNRMLNMGFINVEEAGCLLNHRYATRPGDGVVIWSLMCEEKASHSAIEFWKSRIDRTLNTGFLMSSVPRIGDKGDIPGFNWAPARPDLSPPSNNHGETEARYHSFDGEGSSAGIITENGFQAKWSTAIIKPQSTLGRISSRVSKMSRRKTPGQIRKITDKYLTGWKMGAFLTPLPENLGVISVEYKGNVGGTLLAVVGSNDRGETWCWRGVWEWVEGEKLPEFHEEAVLLV